MTRTLLASALLLSACRSLPDDLPDAPDATPPPVVETLWEVDGLAQPESVLPDPSGQFYYVSLVGGQGSDKDGVGGIATISADGETVDAEWLTGLNAPKGMALRGGKLFVTDIDDVVVIDPATATVERRIPVPGAQFLNDAETYSDGVLVSDSGTGRIHSITGGTSTVWLEGDARLERVNGLFCCERREVLVATMAGGELLAVDLDTKAIRSLAGGMPNADGIVRQTDGAHLVSSWPGQLYRIERNSGVATLLSDTSGEGIKLNDIGPGIGEVDLVGPHWDPGTVTAYRINLDSLAPPPAN